MNFPHSHTTPGVIRGAIRALRDPSIIDGAGPGSRRGFANRRDRRAARHLLDIIIAMQSQL